MSDTLPGNFKISHSSCAASMLYPRVHARKGTMYSGQLLRHRRGMSRQLYSAGGRTVRAGRMVVAVPLTALKSGELAFSPPLPARKQVRSALLKGWARSHARLPATTCVLQTDELGPRINRLACL